MSLRDRWVEQSLTYVPAVLNWLDSDSRGFRALKKLAQDGRAEEVARDEPEFRAMAGGVQAAIEHGAIKVALGDARMIHITSTPAIPTPFCEYLGEGGEPTAKSDEPSGIARARVLQPAICGESGDDCGNFWAIYGPDKLRSSEQLRNYQRLFNASQGALNDCVLRNTLNPELTGMLLLLGTDEEEWAASVRFTQQGETPGAAVAFRANLGSLTIPFSYAKKRVTQVLKGLFPLMPEVKRLFLQGQLAATCPSFWKELKAQLD